MTFKNEKTILEKGEIIHRNARDSGILIKTADGLAIKCFKSKGFLLDLLRSSFSKTKAHKQWSAAQKLLYLELKTPKPIGINLFHPGGTYEAAYIYEYLENAIPFRMAIQSRDSNLLLKQLAKELAHLATHDSVFIDFHLGNILVDSELNLWWIDPELKTSRTYAQKRFWSRIHRMHQKCDFGILSHTQWRYFTQQLNEQLPSWLQDDTISKD